MKKTLIITTLLLLVFGVKAQNTPGNITIIREIALDTLVRRVYYENLIEKKIPGYRIQIYSGSVRMEALKAKSDFMLQHPGNRAYLEFRQPYFRVRVGDYRSRIEAIKMYRNLISNPVFKGVMIVPDEINLPEL